MEVVSATMLSIVACGGSRSGTERGASLRLQLGGHMETNVIPFPVIARRGDEPDVVASRFPKPPPVNDIEKELQMRIVRNELAHVVRKLLIVAECNQELPAAIEMLEGHLAAAKRDYSIKEDGNAD